MTKVKLNEFDKKALRAARFLEEYCQLRDSCDGCPFFDKPSCILSDREDLPCAWDIPKEDEE